MRTLQAGDGSTSGVGLFEVTNAALLVPAAPAVTEVGYVGQLSPDQLMWELSILLDGLLDPPPPPRRAQDGLHRA